MTHFRHGLRKIIGDRPPIVLGLLLLHGAILLQTLLPGLLTAVLYLLARVISLPLSWDFTIYPRLSALSFVWGICFAGLWYFKRWAWFAALVLDGLTIMTSVFAIWRWLSFASFPNPYFQQDSGQGFSLLGTIFLPAICGILLLHPRVQKAYSVDVFIAQHPMLKGAIEKAFGGFSLLLDRLRLLVLRWKKRDDKIIVRVIATLQGLCSLIFLLMVPFMFMYGGAATHPDAFIGVLLFSFYGVVSACLLSYSCSTVARLLAFLWHGVCVGRALSNHLSIDWENPNDRFFGAWVLLSCVAVVYLGASLVSRLVFRNSVASGNSPETTGTA